MNKIRASRNRTVHLSDAEREVWQSKVLTGQSTNEFSSLLDGTIQGDMLDCLPMIPGESVDLLILDPPYNLNKRFNNTHFSKRNLAEYSAWMRAWFVPILRILKPTATVYICSDWSSSPAVYEIASEHLNVRNRITWEREKGRGAFANWKNCSEDIWFCTVGNQYTFNVDAVRLKRRVVAPYRSNGSPKGWRQDIDGQYRFTSPSNLWTDITVPFWSMPENTDHPTQKPEKLIAKLILASSNAGDIVLDPFLGSGTTSVVCKKLNRRYIGIEIEEEYCMVAEKRLALAEGTRTIQGFDGSVFLERNTLTLQMQQKTRSAEPASLFHEA